MLHKLRFYIAYLQKPVWDTGASPPELLDFIEAHQPGKALDFGCGTGTNAITLATHGWDVIGVDFAWQAIQTAKKKAKQNQVNVDFRLADVTEIRSITEQFDLILDIGCLSSLPTNKRPEYIRSINRLLADSGTFLIYLFYKINPADNKPGVTNEDIQFLTETMRLVSRKDGTERGIYPSTWLTFQKQ